MTAAATSRPSKHPTCSSRTSARSSARCADRPGRTGMRRSARAGRADALGCRRQPTRIGVRVFHSVSFFGRLAGGVAGPALALSLLVAPSGVAAVDHSARTGSAAGDSDVGSEALQSAAITDVRRIRLATGDTVRVLTHADGTVTPNLGRTPFLWSGGPEARYVVPRTPASLLHQLDLSLFDITALARVTQHGRTPVVLRLVPGAGTPRVAGLHVHAGTARAVGRGTEVHASYGRHFAGFGSGALRGIASVRLDAPQSKAQPRTAQPAAVPTHTVRVHVARKNGSATDFALVSLQATVDGDSYFEQAHANRTGVATFKEVPEGEYSAVTQTFDKVLVDTQFDVTADTTIEDNLGDATVKPHVDLPGHRKLWTSLNVERDPEQGFGFPFGFAGPHFSMRVRPDSDPVLHGALHTSVTATFVAGRRAAGFDDVALTTDVAEGIPDDLTFVHHRRDFARVTDRFYGNGPAARRPLWLIPGNLRAFIFLGDTSIETPVPGRLHVWVQAGHGNYAQQPVFPLATEIFEGDNTGIGDVRLYRKAGNRGPISFLHGPVGAGFELPPDSPFASGAARDGDRLTLCVPMMTGGGHNAAAFTFVDRKDASWSLHQGAQVLARGHQLLGRVVHVPHGRRTYQLVARTHPTRAWDLSTHVSTVWTVHSRAGRVAVPLLTPSYVPPTDLAGNLRPGPTGFGLSFHSSPHTARVAQVSVELSTDDGRTWHRARVTRRSGLTFHVGFRNPRAHGTAHYMSMRVTASDIHGNAVQETALHVYRLR